MDARASPTGAPWTYASDNYNYDAMTGAGDYCVGFYDASQDTSGTWSIHWSSIWNIDKAKCLTPEITKGYSNLAVGKNLKKEVSAVQSMDTVWNWTATNTEDIKGCITFDFMMGPTAGDYTSSSVKELMLWLWWTGDDLPIGYAEGPVATISLFGKDGWKLYQGMNTQSNQLVSSLLAPEDEMYTGNFEGDLKDWFTALSDAGQYQVYPSTYYVNVGNMGTEAWYGDVTFDFYVSGFELAL
ncbi:glycoside hydrolase family 12 protein [Lophiostoma macrostomum CBS 122681]|uniref:Glycoside hydrolase family 12 protein n=1 Tax=Lophiostoma macrostomum CBS 122681 TaxID=1314788 RepID=A0A6A6T3F7_9PLEO|nr:glycoside hydrolase family 12 protein [Lophiostoma macrostomum CBS 122681]